METIKHNIIIAFDGPDNVGKGTQIALLRKWQAKIPFVITNLDKPVGLDNSEKINYGLSASRNLLLANKAICKQDVPQIVDRMHYTEYAYSILRGGHSLQTILELEREFLELQASLFTIIFIDTIENITARDDGKSNYNIKDKNEIQSITNRFIEIAEHSIFDNVVINIHGKNIETVQKEVIKNLIKKFPNLEK